MCADGIAIVDETEVAINCNGCGQEIAPDTTSWELFRLGYQIHNDDDCFNLMLTNMGVA